MLTVGPSVRRERPGACPWRSALATVEVMTAVLLAHTVAGGALPSVAWTLAMTAGVYAGSLAVLTGRVRMRVAVPVLAVVQLLLHGWLVVLTPGHAAEVGHQHVGSSGAGAGNGATTALSASLGLDWPMVLAHLAGALVTAWVWTARRRAVDLVLRWGAALPPHFVRGSVTRPASRTGVRRSDGEIACVPVRGPPRASLHA